MKISTAILALLLALAACSTQKPQPHETQAAPTTTKIYGPTVANPRPLTPREKFIFDYRSMKPGDVRTDGEVFALNTIVCGSIVNGTLMLDSVLRDFRAQGFTPEEAGWIVARAECS